MAHHHPTTPEELTILQNITKDIVFIGQPPETGVTYALHLLNKHVTFLAHHEQVRPVIAMDHMQVLGGIVATAERHSQAAGQDPGAVIAAVPGLETQLARLGKVAGTVPYVTAASIWLHGKGFLFTGVEGEEAFRDSVRVNNSVMLTAVRLLTRVTEGDLEWVDILYQLGEALERVTVLKSEYNSFRLRDGKTPFKMTVEEFILGMREMLGPVTIQGVEYSGPNAAYTEGPATFDAVLGTADDMFINSYLPTVRPYLTKAGRHRLDAVLNAPTVFDVLIAPTGMSKSGLAVATPEQVAAIIGRMPVEYLKSVETYRKIRATYASASSAHMQAIKVYLMNVDQHLSPVQIDRMVVKAEEGTGGHGHAATERLTTMRGSSLAEDVLVAAAGLVAS